MWVALGQSHKNKKMITKKCFSFMWTFKIDDNEEHKPNSEKAD